MARTITIKRGLDLKLNGTAPRTLLTTPSGGASSTYAWVPDDVPGLTPKMKVHVGDHVEAGDPIVYDKQYPEVWVTAPVSGELVAINRGAKRKIMSVEIRPDESQTQHAFAVEGLLEGEASKLQALLLESGLWTLIRQRPYDRIADPTIAPRDIFVTAHLTAPLAPEIDYLLEGREEELRIGLRALARLTAGKVYVGVAQGSPLTLPVEVVPVEVRGPHPAGNVGVLINHVAPINKGETVWTLRATDVALIGRLLMTGHVDYTRRIAITGSHAAEHGYMDLLPGCRLESLGKLAQDGGKMRIIAGDVLTGTQLTEERPFLPMSCDQITVIPDGSDRDELLGWAMPRLGEFSQSRTYLSWLMPRKRYTLDARLKGGKRAMIMSHELQSVFPLDIHAEYLLKAIIAFDIDKMEELGIYEVAPEDFALCEFVDTSKMELQHIVRQGLDLLYKEMN